ncbi:hypothetical protein D3C76_597220 [compost metagenome]
MRQEEWIRLAAALAVLIGRLGGHQTVVIGGAGAVADVGVADQALGHALGVEACQLSQGAGDQQLGHTNAKAAGDQLQAQHQAGPVELRPERWQALADLFGRQPAKGQQVSLDPVGQAIVAALAVLRQQQRNGLGKVAHGLVTFFEQPVGQCCQGSGQLTQHTGGHQLPGAATGQEVNGPGRIVGRGLGKVIAQRFELGVAGGGRVQAQVQRGKGLHASAPAGVDSSSSPYSVAKARASRPCSLR